MQNFFEELNRKLEVNGLIGRGGPPTECFRLEGHVHYRLYDEMGRLKQEGHHHNLVTSIGDMYFAQFCAFVVEYGLPELSWPLASRTFTDSKCQTPW